MCFYIILKIFCLAPFSIDFKTLKVQQSSFSSIVSVFIVSICLFFDEPLERMIYEDHDTYFVTKLIKLFNSLLTLKSYALIAVLVLLIIFKNQRQRKAFQDLLEVIPFLNWKTLSLILRKNTKKFIEVQLFFVLYFIIARYFYYIAPNKNPKWLISLFYLPISQYRYYIVITVVAQKQFVFIFFKCCFKALNTNLKAQIKRCNPIELSDYVDKTAKVHFRLLEIIFYLNKHFSVISLMIFLDVLANFVVEDFIVYLSSMLYYRDHSTNDHVLRSFIIEIVLVALYGLVRIGQIFVILYAGCNTIKEVNELNLY